MRYTFRQLEYFIAAGETGSVTLASERVGISQPSISVAIAHLESEFGVQLFVRHHAQGLSLTAAGRELMQGAKRVIEQADGLYTIATEASEQVRGQMSVGCFVTLAPMVMPQLSHSFTQAYPATRIRLVEHDQERLLEGLLRAEIDVAITYDLQIPKGIAFTPLVGLPAHVLVGEGDEVAGRTSISLREVARKPMILLDLPISREYFLSLFLTLGLEPSIAMRSAHQEVVRTMVANGFGYTLANVRPRSDLALDGKRLVRVPLEGEHQPMVLGIATLTRLKKSRLVEAFEAHCKALVSEASIPGMD